MKKCIYVYIYIYFRFGSQSFDETVRDPGPKTTCEVAIFASGTWKKVTLLCFILFYYYFTSM